MRGLMGDLGLGDPQIGKGDRGDDRLIQESGAIKTGFPVDEGETGRSGGLSLPPGIHIGRLGFSPAVGVRGGSPPPSQSESGFDENSELGVVSSSVGWPL